MDPVTPVTPASAMPGNMARASAVEAMLRSELERPDFHRVEVQHRRADAHSGGDQGRVTLETHRTGGDLGAILWAP